MLHLSVLSVIHSRWNVIRLRFSPADGKIFTPALLVNCEVTVRAYVNIVPTICVL